MSGASDTSREARQAQCEVMRRAGAPARLRMALEMSEFVRELTLRRIRMQRPELSRSEAIIALVREFHPAALPHDY